MTVDCNTFFSSPASKHDFTSGEKISKNLNLCKELLKYGSGEGIEKMIEIE